MQVGPLFELILNNRLDVHISYKRLVQLSLYQLIMKAKDVVSLELPRDLLLEALPNISQLLVEILVLLHLLRQGSLNEFVPILQLLEYRRVSSLKISDIRVRRERLENHCRYLLRNTKVILDTHMSKGTCEPIIRYISLEECILRVELDSVINVYSTKDASYRIMTYNLIVNSIVYKTYLGC